MGKIEGILQSALKGGVMGEKTEPCEAIPLNDNDLDDNKSETIKGDFQRLTELFGANGIIYNGSICPSVEKDS